METNKLYIDTQVFVANNFFNGKNLDRLASLANEGTIEIYMNEITKNEIINRGKIRLQEVIPIVKQFNEQILKNARILRNLDNFSLYFNLPKIDIKRDLEILKEKLDQFIVKANVIIIPFDNADINDIFYRYFNEKKPFSIGKKKSEFPDAVVLSSVEQYCKENGQKMYFLSGDSDFENATSNNVIHIAKIDSFLDMINRHLAKENEPKWYEKVFYKNIGQVKEKIRAKYESKIEDEFSWEENIEDIEISEIEISELSLVENDKNGTYHYQVTYDITLSANVGYPDYSESTYDKEDDIHYNVFTTFAPIHLSTTEAAEISIEAYPDDEPDPEKTEAIITCKDTSTPNYSTIINSAEYDV